MNQRILILIFSIIFFAFFVSTYFAFAYLQNHIDSEDVGFMSQIGLPNTRNIIKKWSLDHGVADFALPANVRSSHRIGKDLEQIQNLQNNIEVGKNLKLTGI